MSPAPDATVDHRLVFLSSGGGGNLRFVEAVTRKGILPRWTIAGVIADRECQATEFARGAGISCEVISLGSGDQRHLVEALAQFDPTLVVTTVHKILVPSVLESFPGRFVNIHYSLLPAFAGCIGAETVRRALQYGSTMIGATTHRVAQEVDMGEPIFQIALPLQGDLLGEAMDLVFRAGALSLFFALESWDVAGIEADRRLPLRTNWMKIADRQCLVSPPARLPAELEAEQFWQALK